jgi:hypothetical protein
VLKHFIVPSNTVRKRAKLIRLLELLEIAHTFFQRFHVQAEEIVLGVATLESKRRDDLILTTRLVHSFRSYVLVHVRAAHLLGAAERHFRNETTQSADMLSPESHRKMAKLRSQLDEAASESLAQIKDAYQEVTLWSRADAHLSAVQVQSVGLPSVVAGLLSNAQRTLFNDSEGVVKRYEICVVKLVGRGSLHECAASANSLSAIPGQP